uniref:Uncharacterized protein n=1 Tax=Arundo donax TaxID=35708 RepID=A0A0A9B5U3_ARUDO
MQIDKKIHVVQHLIASHSKKLGKIHTSNFQHSLYMCH